MAPLDPRLDVPGDGSSPMAHSIPDSAAGEPRPASDPRYRPGQLGLALAALVAFVAVGLAVGGEVTNVAAAGLAVLPLIVLIGLVQTADVWPRTRLLAWTWFWLLLVGLGLLTVGLTLGAVAADAGDAAANSGQLFDGEMGAVLALSSGLLLVALVVTCGLVATGAWLWVGRALGGRVRPGQTSDAQGVAGLLFLVAAAAVPPLVLDGEPPLLSIVGVEDGFDSGRSATGEVLDLYYNLAWMAPLALIGAGAPMYHGLSLALARLGLLRLRPRDVAAMVAVAGGLVVLATGIDWLIAAVWDVAGWPRTDTTALDRLFQAASTPVGALSAALSAGVGEELVVRGLLQPRFGWLLPNLAFTAAHAYQYGVDGLLSVFVIGAALAAVRARWNTTAAVLAHVFYDLVLLLAAIAELPGF
jgi:membrane protease YdiL (CAAX protease family)